MNLASIAPPMSLKRLAGTAGLLAIVAFLAGITAATGGVLIARGALERGRVATEARYYAIARSALADAAASTLATLPGVKVVAERGLAELLPAPTAKTPVPDRLRVVELSATLPPVPEDLELTVEAIRDVDGVVDVVDLNAGERAARTTEAARRWLFGGLLLAAVGCVSFVLGVTRATAVAVQEAAEELSVRVLLGADPPRLWIPFGVWLGLAACVGTIAAVVAMAVAARWLGPLAEAAVSEPGTITAGSSASSLWVAIAGALALVVGACAVAGLSARRAVFRLAFGRDRSASSARAAVAAALLLAALLPVGVLADDATRSDTTHLRQLDRDLTVARHALHQAERSLLGSEHRAIRAVASGDAVATQLAAAQLAVEAGQVERWRASRDGLLALRTELRAQRKAERAPGPPIAPRLKPVHGGLATGFRQSPGGGGLRGFRNGIALRTVPGEVIRATAGGRVAYAAELAGAGPVVVLSHGRRTYSVYGRIAELLVARGMHVEPGEPIARASDQPGLLYFAVRERSRPIDPVRWLLEVEEDGAGSRRG